MSIITIKNYTALLNGGLTFTVGVQWNGIITVAANWANGEPMGLDDLTPTREDLIALAELFAHVAEEVNE